MPRLNLTEEEKTQRALESKRRWYEKNKEKRSSYMKEYNAKRKLVKKEQDALRYLQEKTSLARDRDGRCRVSGGRTLSF